MATSYILQLIPTSPTVPKNPKSNRNTVLQLLLHISRYNLTVYYLLRRQRFFNKQKKNQNVIA